MVAAMKIVSLLPSATEIVCALGLEDQLVGVTHECDYPESVRNLPKVTHTLIPADASSQQIDQLVRERLQQEQPLYSLDLAVLEKLQPDLIVTQALCGVCAVAESEVQAAARELPGEPEVVNLEPQTLGEVIDSLHDVAVAADVEEKAAEVMEALNARVDRIADVSEALQYRPRVALLEWLDPPFSCGHWNPELVRLAGGLEDLGREGQASRTLRWNEVIAWQPEVILIACCGYSVERTLADLPLLQSVHGWDELPAVRRGRVYVVDGSQYFSRPGPRLVDSLEMLAHLLHPDLHPLTQGLPQPLRIENKDYSVQNFTDGIPARNP